MGTAQRFVTTGRTYAQAQVAICRPEPNAEVESMKHKQAHNLPDNPDERREWVAGFLARGKAFRRLSQSEREDLVDSVTRIIDYWTDTAGREAEAEALVDAIDFPDFVSSLVQGVFDAIVGASIQQMEAYQDLLNSVAQTIDQFREDSVTDTQAVDYLVSTFPDVFARRDGPSHVVERRCQASEDRWALALALLGSPEADQKTGTHTQSESLVHATRRHLVRGR